LTALHIGGLSVFSAEDHYVHVGAANIEIAEQGISPQQTRSAFFHPTAVLPTGIGHESYDDAFPLRRADRHLLEDRISHSSAILRSLCENENAIGAEHGNVAM